MTKKSNSTNQSMGHIDQTKTFLIKNALVVSLSMYFLSSQSFAIAPLINNQTETQSIKPLSSNYNLTSSKPNNSNNIPTKKYTVSIGETSNSIAQRFNINLELLKTLNSSIPFKNELTHLKVGDIILVPLTPLPKEIPIANKNSSIENLERKNQIANMAAQIGSMLETNPNSDAASAMARNIATSTVNSSLEKWFSQYGRLRAQVSVDEKFSLKNSQYDLLLPIWEDKQNLVFSQASVHRTDDRNQANLGFGIRRFYDNYMIGGNTFLDYDMSNDHSRAGIGGEYWSNFLKVSANGYLRLSNWKDSKKVEDYEERAANGWDIRTEGYLPAYPQLGGKLMYEKYYGNEVALFGKDNRQENPQALTVGVSYTPIPLITMNAEHKQGQDGKKDTLIGMQMNFQMGVPWAKQIDPKAVSALRSLAGNRYDFVERNNNIVLEYRKKELIFLSMANPVRGFSGEQKSLEVSVQAKYGLDRIEWDAAEIISQGGEVVQQGNDYLIKLPDYKYGRTAPANTYTISAIAYDMQGNASARQTSQIEVTEAAVSAINSEFTPNNTTLVANSSDNQVLNLMVKDYQGHPIHISPSEIELNVNSKTRGNVPAQVSEWRQVKEGEYEVTVTAGTQVETLTLTPTVRGVSLAPAHVEMVAGEIDQVNSTLSASPKEIIANGEDETEVSLTLEDEQNNPIKGKTVTFSLGGVSNTKITEVTEKNGVYTAKLSGTKAGIAVVTAIVDGIALNAKEEVTLKAGPIDVIKSIIKASPITIIANGKDTSTISLELFDRYNNHVNEGSVTFEATGVESTTLSPVEYKDEVYTVQLSGTKGGKVLISPTFNDTKLDIQKNVELREITSISTDFSNRKPTIKGSSTLRIIPLDSESKLLPNVEVTLNFSSQDRQKQPRSETLKINGTDVTQNMKLTANDKGVIEVTLTDPNGIGVEHMITISIDGGPSETVSIPFLVDTSPDTDKAQMWGDMAETLNATDGTSFQRPKLAAETSGYQATNIENNETWALFNAQEEGIYAHCGSVEKIPTKDNYNSLFNRLGTTIPSEYGWPKNKLYRSSSSGAGVTKYAYWLQTGLSERPEVTDLGQFGTELNYNGYASCKKY